MAFVTQKMGFCGCYIREDNNAGLKRRGFVTRRRTGFVLIAPKKKCKLLGFVVSALLVRLEYV